MAKPIFQLVRKHGVIASQNTHLGRSLYTGKFPTASNEFISFEIKDFLFEEKYIPPVEIDSSASLKVEYNLPHVIGSSPYIIYEEKYLPKVNSTTGMNYNMPYVVGAAPTILYEDLLLPKVRASFGVMYNMPTIVSSKVTLTTVTAKNLDKITMFISEFKGI